MSHASTLDKPNASTEKITRYVYFMASNHNVSGDRYLYTDVFKIEANTESGIQFQIHTLLLEFEDVLYELYPESHLVASTKWVAGSFLEANIARLERNYAVQQHAEKAVEVAIREGIVANE